MKRIKLLILVLSMFCLTSCSKKEINFKIIYDHNIEDYNITIKKGTIISEPAQPTLNEATLEGYYFKDGSEFSFDNTINEDTVVYAKWKFNEYTYTFFDANKQIIKKETVPYGTKVVYPNDPTKEGGEGYIYQFEKWNINDEYVLKNLNFYPIFNKVYDTFDITINDLDGNIVNKETYNYGDYLREPARPTFNTPQGSYTKFLGWFVDDTDEVYDFNNTITKSFTLTPRILTAPFGKIKLEEATISILGDSISTFYNEKSEHNSLYPGTNQFYYPTYSQTVITCDKTWWCQTITGLGAKFGINNSLSGSTAAGTGSKVGESTVRLSTLDKKGTPNIVIIFLGTNDNVSGHSADQVNSAYETIISYISNNFIDYNNGYFIKPYIYIFNNGYSSYTGFNYKEETRIAYNNMFSKLADKYEYVKLFDLASLVTKDNYQLYLGDFLHYNATGMKLISDNLIKQIKADFTSDIEEINIKLISQKAIVLYFDRKKEIY